MEKLGVQLPLLLTQLVNFTIMLLVLTKLLYKPILKNLEKRRQKIEEGFSFAEKMKGEEEKLKERKEELLKETRDEARVLLENARKEAKVVKDEIVAEGKKEAELIKVKLEKELKGRAETLTAQITAHTVDIATEMVKRLLPELLSDEAQHRLIQKRLQQMERRHEE